MYFKAAMQKNYKFDYLCKLSNLGVIGKIWLLYYLYSKREPRKLKECCSLLYIYLFYASFNKNKSTTRKKFLHISRLAANLEQIWDGLETKSLEASYNRPYDS